MHLHTVCMEDSERLLTPLNRWIFEGTSFIQVPRIHLGGRAGGVRQHEHGGARRLQRGVELRLRLRRR